MAFAFAAIILWALLAAEKGVDTDGTKKQDYKKTSGQLSENQERDSTFEGRVNRHETGGQWF